MSNQPLSGTSPNLSETNRIQRIKHSLYETDWAISRILAWLVQFIFMMCIIAASLVTIIAELINMFEYSEWISDLSVFEILFIVLFFLAVKRYCRYVSRTSLKWWQKISTPFLWHGKILILFMMITLPFLMSDLLFHTRYFADSMLLHEHASQLINFIVILVSFYIAVPGKNKRKEMNEPNETEIASVADHEPKGSGNVTE